jgi:hypothetical protein
MGAWRQSYSAISSSSVGGYEKCHATLDHSLPAMGCKMLLTSAACLSDFLDINF